MIEIIIGSIIISTLHVIIPNHWIPIVVIAKAEKWTWHQTFFATVFSGFAHTSSTIFLGTMVGFTGYKLSERYSFISHQLAPVILIVLGVIFVMLDRRKGHHHSHNDNDLDVKNKSYRAILFSLSLSLFLTPCIEIEAYYFKAGSTGWPGIIAVSVIYMIFTILSMTILVYAGIIGVKKIRSHYLEHHEKLITGLVLVILGVISLLIQF